MFYEFESFISLDLFIIYFCLFSPAEFLTNTDMFDLENDLPDELMTSSSWGATASDASGKPPATGPGPGMQNGGLNPQDAAAIQRQHVVPQQQLSHHIMPVSCSNLK